MLQIAGKPLKQTDLWEKDSIEGVIVKKMQEAKVLYTYQTLEELFFELKFRKNIINSAIEMSKGEAKFHIFSQSRGNPKYWKISKAGGFQLRPGVKPSDAIRDIFINSSLYTFECATASVMILYDALLKMIGESTFNAYFQNLYLYSWHIDSDYHIHTFYGNHRLPGDFVYFKNPDFNPKTYWWRGLNAVYLGDENFFGHGFRIRTGKFIINFFNEKRRPDSKTPAYLSKLITRPIFKNLAKLLAYPRTEQTYKLQHPVIHHNQSSISHAHYLAFFHKCPFY